MIQCTYFYINGKTYHGEQNIQTVHKYTRAKYIQKEQMYCMHCMYSTNLKLGRLLLLSKGHSGQDILRRML